eukprot:TRINITY_DN4854_c0_g1_i3.p1 TRINITY_DN4854_c0_g1~~TRINITY_DN4854_c0_g1_i3.p1  ORF type:complete len:342 (-),score=64.87 TRINITY_DN4854_c0_g1_i3:47-1072(-)
MLRSCALFQRVSIPRTWQRVHTTGPRCIARAYTQPAVFEGEFRIVQQGGPRTPLGTWGSILKPVLFTVAGVTSACVTAEYFLQKRMLDKYAPLSPPSRASRPSPSDMSISGRLRRWWGQYSDSSKTIACIIAANTLVFLAWRIPARVPGIGSAMSRYFLSHTHNSRVLPLLLNNFSHVTPMHLLFNMFALYSFGKPVHDAMGREHFLSLYISSGLFSSLASHVLRLVTLSSAYSLGASGCVCGIIAACTYLYPDSRMSIIFLPFFSFDASSGLAGLVVFDTLGMLGVYNRLGLPLNLDHAAHLGGVATGGAYMYAFKHYLPSIRTKMLRSQLEKRRALAQR